MKQVGNMKNVHMHRQIAKEVSVSKAKKTGKAAFSYPTKGISGTEPRKFVEAKDVGPGIITKGVVWEDK